MKLGAIGPEVKAGPATAAVPPLPRLRGGAPWNPTLPPAV
jgi:hypothetical protein